MPRGKNRTDEPVMGGPGAWSVRFKTPFGAAAAFGVDGAVLRILLPGSVFSAKEYGPARLRSSFRASLEAYAAGSGPAPGFGLPWSSPFDASVLCLISKVPRGEIVTYGHIAASLGRPGCARAVGGAAGRNPLPILIPCHRVVGSDGRLTGFSAAGGIGLKRRMLESEGVGFLPGPGDRVAPDIIPDKPSRGRNPGSPRPFSG